MDIFDIIGPVMIGPSSSHTAGAVRIGRVAAEILGEPVRTARSACAAALPRPTGAPAPTRRWWRVFWALRRTTPASGTA